MGRRTADNAATRAKDNRFKRNDVRRRATADALSSDRKLRTSRDNALMTQLMLDNERVGERANLCEGGTNDVKRARL